MPLISIIIPTYNSAQYLSEALNSALSQTYKHFEIIVIDDGSTDNTLETVSRYTKEYPGKIRSFYQENRGPATTRNRGIKEANGEYIAFLDSDDIWLPEKLRLQVDIFAAHPDVAMIFTDAESFNENGIIRHSKSRSQFVQKESSFRYKILQKKFNDGSILKGNLYEEMLIRNIVTTTSTVLVDSKKLLSVGLFNINLPPVEDYELWLRIAQKYPFLYLNKITARYRVRVEGLSGNLKIRSFQHSEWRGRMFELYIANSSHKYREMIKKNVFQSYRNAAWGYFNLNKFREARKMSKLSLKYNKFQIKLYLYILISLLPKRLILSMKKIKRSISRVKTAILELR